VGAYSITQIKKILQTRKTRQINLFNAIPKTFKDAKFVVDGNVFQTFISLLYQRKQQLTKRNFAMELK